jgi:hypothetical protein
MIRRPSIKQIKMAEEFAAKAGVAVPVAAYDSMEKCSEFITSLYKPTQNQMNLAQLIFKKSGIAPIKPFAEMTPGEISAYIRENNPKIKAVSDKYKGYVRVMASKLGLETPDMDDDDAIVAFAEEHKEEFARRFPK